jgi:hypothetical protein
MSSEATLIRPPLKAARSHSPTTTTTTAVRHRQMTLIHMGAWGRCRFSFITVCIGTREIAASKIAIDLSNVNAEGLRGSGTGLRAVHYEYCIPTGQRHEAEVRSIDATAQFMRGSRGRIGCSSAQVLVLGNTHQPEYRQVLDRLAALPYVNRIMESFFE